MAEQPIILEVEGLKELQEALKKYPDEWNRLAKETMIYGTATIVSRAKELAPWDTGRLSANIGAGTKEGIFEVTRVGSEIIGRIGSKVVYAAIQEYGGTVTAKNAPYLVFRTKDGSWHSVTSVTIPPHSYLRPALKEKAGEAVKRFEVKINEILRRLKLR